MALRTRNFFKPRNAVQQNFTQDCDSNVLQGNGGGIAFSIQTITPPVGTEIDVTNAITITFAAPANPGAVSFPRENGVAKAGGLSWNANFTQLTFTPAADWAEGANVDWDLSVFQAADGSGPAANAFVAQWTVETLFALISVSPDPADPTDPLTLRKPIVATFNGPVTDPSVLPIIMEGGVQKPGSWTLGPGANEATFTPATDWDGNTTVTLDPSTGTAPNGDPIGGPVSTWTVPPLPFDYVSAAPAAGSTIAGTQTVTLTFSDDVAPSSTIVVMENGVAKAGTWVMNDVTAVFTPSTPWVSGATVTVDTSAAVSVDGVSNTTPTVVPYSVPVTFTQTAVSPVTGGSIFGTDTITVSFNEPADPSTMPLPTENGVAKLGTWAASGNDLIFTPSAPYLSGATVVVDWVSVTDALGNTPTNPGAASYNVLLDFSFASSAPGAGGYVVLRDTIALTFNRAIDPATLPMPLENGVAKPGSWSFSGNVATFTPSADWGYGTSVTLDYTGGQSTDGVPLTNPGTLAFTVPNQLVQTLVAPATGSTLTNANTIAVTFNQAIDVSSMPLPTNSGGTPVPGTWAASGATVTFTPAANWVLGDTFTVDWSAARSLFNLPVTNPGTATYNTIPAFSATSVSPTSGSYIYGTNGISVTFNRAVNVSTLPAPTSNGAAVAGSWSVSGSTATFTPTNPWTSGETVVMDYTTATDTLGNAVVNPNTATYLVAAELYQTATAVEHATTLAALDTIYVTFDQPIDISTMPLPTRTDTNASISGTWTLNGNVATFTPSNSWRLNSSFPAYTVQVDWSAVTSPVGVPVSNPGTDQWNVVLASLISFSTDAQGSTIPTTDANLLWGFTNGTPTSFPPITYSDGTPVPGNWVLAGSQIAFTPSQTYIPGETISIDWHAVADANGHPPHNVVGLWTYNVEAFKYVSVATAEGDGNVRDLETVTFTFNAPVDQSTLPMGFATSDATPAFGMGSWTVSGNTATFTPSNPWQNVGTGPYNFSLGGMTDANGNAISNPQTVPVAEEVVFFRYVSSPNVIGAQSQVLSGGTSEPYAIKFTDTPDLATMPTPQYYSTSSSFAEFPVGGSWSLDPNDNTVALYTPSVPWTFEADVLVRLDATVLATSGQALTQARLDTHRITGNLTYNAQAYYDGATLRGGAGDVDVSDPLVMTFDMGNAMYRYGTVDIANLPLPQQSGVDIPGTWSLNVGSPTQVKFTPTGTYAEGVDITVDLSNAATTEGTPLSNPSTVTWTVVPPAFTFAFRKSEPVSGSAVTNGFQIEFNAIPAGDTVSMSINGNPLTYNTHWQYHGHLGFEAQYGLNLNQMVADGLAVGDGTDVLTVDYSAMTDVDVNPISNGGTLTYTVMPAQTFVYDHLSGTPVNMVNSLVRPYGTAQSVAFGLPGGGTTATFTPSGNSENVFPSAIEGQYAAFPVIEDASGNPIAGSWDAGTNLGGGYHAYNYTFAAPRSANEIYYVDYSVATTTDGATVFGMGNFFGASQKVPNIVAQRPYFGQAGSPHWYNSNQTISYFMSANGYPIDMSSISVTIDGVPATNLTGGFSGLDVQPEAGGWVNGQVVVIDMTAAVDTNGTPINNRPSAPITTTVNIYDPAGFALRGVDSFGTAEFGFDLINGPAVTTPTVLVNGVADTTGSWVEEDQSGQGAVVHQYTYVGGTIASGDVITFSGNFVDANGKATDLSRYTFTVQ